ncbi:hypothetical protein [Streptomyces sp. NPDC058867]|uniref:hypothetical protein n=1 Tax=unclassified Streptomyces TaxID=2593676 RepID=UPI0036CE8421
MSALMTAMGALLRGRQRVLVVAIRLLPLLLVTACWAPALTVLPLWPSGHTRALSLLTNLKDWSLGLQMDNATQSGS